MIKDIITNQYQPFLSFRVVKLVSSICLFHEYSPVQKNVSLLKANVFEGVIPVTGNAFNY